MSMTATINGRAVPIELTDVNLDGTPIGLSYETVRLNGIWRNGLVIRLSQMDNPGNAILFLQKIGDNIAIDVASGNGWEGFLVPTKGDGS